MKKLYKQLRDIDEQIAEVNTAVENMNEWDNLDAYDRQRIADEKQRLPILHQKRHTIIQKIKEWADKELETYNDKAHADAA